MFINQNFNASALQESAFREIDMPCDNFLKIARIQTDLLWGNPSDIDKPWLSVLLPTFQRQQFFSEALDSVLSQNPIEVAWECIVVDNTPLDERGVTPALEIIQKQNDSRILYYHNRVNIGSGYNWNRGVELARGEWVVFLHDDDILYPNALKSLLKIMRTQRGKKPLGYVHARRDQFSDFAQLSQLKHKEKAKCEELTRFKSLLLGTSGTGVPSCGTAILKKAYLEVGGINYDFGLTADAVLGYQIMKQYRVIISDIPLGAYRWSDNETLKVSSLQNLICSDYLFAQYRYLQSQFAKIWGRLFWRAEYQENLENKCKIGNHMQFSLMYSDLKPCAEYRPVSLFTMLVYKITRKLLLVLCDIATAVQYRFKNAAGK